MLPFHSTSSTWPHSLKQGEQQEKKTHRVAQKHEMGKTKIKRNTQMIKVTKFIVESLVVVGAGQQRAEI